MKTSTIAICLILEMIGALTAAEPQVTNPPAKRVDMKQRLVTSLIASTLMAVVVVGSAGAQDADNPAAAVSDYNVVWDSPSADCNGSMPIGNGDIGANVWVEENGDLLFYLSKTDAWDEHARLVKLGKIRVSLTPNPFAKGCAFKQELDLRDGVIHITGEARGPDISVDLRFWIDANHPVVRITGSCAIC